MTQTHEARNQAAAVLRRLLVRQAAEELQRSEDVRDERLGNDLDVLTRVTESRWPELLEIVDHGLVTAPPSEPASGPAGRERALLLTCVMNVAGLIVVGDGQLRPHGRFAFHLIVPRELYPMVPAAVKFLEPVPFCPHVVHRDHLPQRAAFSAELREHLASGHGYCCYVKRAEWTAAPWCNLAQAVWQVSRVVTWTAHHGEASSLNPTARDMAIRRGRPLGDPLPVPFLDEPRDTSRPLEDDVELIGGPDDKGATP